MQLILVNYFNPKQTKTKQKKASTESHALEVKQQSKSKPLVEAERKTNLVWFVFSQTRSVSLTVVQKALTFLTKQGGSGFWEEWGAGAIPVTPTHYHIQYHVCMTSILYELSSITNRQLKPQYSL